MNLPGFFGEHITGLTQRDINAIREDILMVANEVGKRLREHDSEIADLRQQVESLRLELAAIKREPHKPFAQKLREKGKL